MGSEPYVWEPGVGDLQVEIEKEWKEWKLSTNSIGFKLKGGWRNPLRAGWGVPEEIELDKDPPKEARVVENKVAGAAEQNEESHEKPSFWQRRQRVVTKTIFVSIILQISAIIQLNKLSFHTQAIN